MNFARRVFLIAAVYGLIVLTPMYFLERKTGEDRPPPITHPEYYYGFIGVALAWQFAFLVISRDPARYRPLMIPSVIEKLTFAVAVAVLFLRGRTGSMMLAAGLVDLTWAVLFVIALSRTSRVSVKTLAAGAGPS